MFFYYPVYWFLYLVSLLPLRVLYCISDFVFFILYYLSGYRKEIVNGNLLIAFPEKSEEERKQIAKEFYRNFTDTFIEMLKMISISAKEVQKRGDCDFVLINSLIDKGYNIHIMAGHQFNWEFANLVYALHLKIPFVGIYMPVGNKIMDRIFFKMRSKFGTMMMSAHDFKHKMHNVFSKQYLLALGADQNPSNPSKAYWLNFFSKPAPFVTGPAKGAVKNNTAVVFVGFHKVKRGYYSFNARLVTEAGVLHTPEELTIKYKKLLEETLRENPSNYLWSHRRWRHDWKPEYGEVISDEKFS